MDANLFRLKISSQIIFILKFFEKFLGAFF